MTTDLIKIFCIDFNWDQQGAVRPGLFADAEPRRLLDRYGTAVGGGRFVVTPEQAYLPGLT